MATIKFTSNLNRFYPALKPIEFNGKTINEALERANTQFPGIKEYIVDEQGVLRQHVNIFINNEMIQDRNNLGDPIEDLREIYIMQAISGG